MRKHEEHFMLDGVEVKRCCDCGRILPVTMNYYFKDSSAWDGIMHSCRECRGYKFKPIVREGFKICNKCGRELEICPNNFRKITQLKDGLDGTCRKCRGMVDPPIPKEGFKFCNKCGGEFPKTAEYFKKHKGCRDGLEGVCRTCVAGQRKQYYAENKEYILEKCSRYRQSHKEKISAYFREYNKTRIKRVLSEQSIINKRKSDKAYYQSHKEKFYLYNQIRRARKKQLPATLTKEQWSAIKDYFNNSCCYCGRNLQLTQDHFIPLSKQGEYTLNNIVPACQHCNCSKNDSYFEDWYVKQPFYSPKREKSVLEFLGYKGRVQQKALM